MHWHLLDFFYWIRMQFLSYLIFFLRVCCRDSHRTLHLALGLVGMHSAAAPMWAVTKFSYSSFRISFRYFLKSIEFVSYTYCIFIPYTSIGKWEPVVTCDFVSYFCIDSGISLPWQFYDQKLLLQKWSMPNSSQYYLFTSC